MIFRQLFDRDSSSYSYLLADKNTREAVLIDPVLAHVTSYLQLLEELGLTLKIAMDTHTHADHITALGKLRDHTECITMMGQQAGSTCASDSFEHEQQIRIGSLIFKALYTPGHTDDSYSFLLEHAEESYLFSGDTLLIRGTGRTDFQNGNARQQYQSLSALLNLPDNTWVYPAHDYKGWTVSTIGEEKQHNPRLQVANVAEYERIMANLNLTNPRLMDIAVPANRACGNID